MTQPSPNDDARLAFRAAVGLASRGLVADALGEFQSIAERWPRHAVADDALYDVGACLLAMNQFRKAEETFLRVIEVYPDATIEPTHPPRESGRTAARAWLGVVHARLGQGNARGAREALRRLEAYGDSKVVAAPGIERTYHDIALSLVDSTAGRAEAVDEVGPGDALEEGAAR